MANPVVVYLGYSDRNIDAAVTIVISDSNIIGELRGLQPTRCEKKSRQVGVVVVDQNRLGDITVRTEDHNVQQTVAVDIPKLYIVPSLADSTGRLEGPKIVGYLRSPTDRIVCHDDDIREAVGIDVPNGLAAAERRVGRPCLVMHRWHERTRLRRVISQ